MNIEITDLSVRYDHNEVLRCLTGEVDSGQWLALIGPNGSGKSTLLRCVAGLISFSGSITVGERAIASATRREIARLIAFVPQRPQLPALMSVRDYVLLGRTPHISYLGTEDQKDYKVVAETLERLSLTSFAERALDELSGGESQRVVLARALAQQAPVLLLDEPTSSLDLGRQQQVLELVDELRGERELTVISALHDLTLAGQFADTLWLMAPGQVVARGSAEQVLRRDVIEEHYEAFVKVQTNEDGSVVVIPLRERQKTNDRKR